mmetsp:Transcript_40090/g.128596  ORF Transcript_40090/g.128596 Transcript_40090/m.128596 type:complete len:270 (-) Transcript_40090:1268-2077(-)
MVAVPSSPSFTIPAAASAEPSVVTAVGAPPSDGDAIGLCPVEAPSCKSGSPSEGLAMPAAEPLELASPVCSTIALSALPTQGRTIDVTLTKPASATSERGCSGDVCAGTAGSASKGSEAFGRRASARPPPAPEPSSECRSAEPPDEAPPPQNEATSDKEDAKASNAPNMSEGSSVSPANNTATKTAGDQTTRSEPIKGNRNAQSQAIVMTQNDNREGIMSSSFNATHRAESKATPSTITNVAQRPMRAAICKKTYINNRTATTTRTIAP